MREYIIIQGLTVGYRISARMEAFLNREAPSSLIEELLADGYAVCITE